MMFPAQTARLQQSVNVRPTFTLCSDCRGIAGAGIASAHTWRYPAADVAHLTAGDPAPPFELPDQDGGVVRLSDFKGRKVLVYFYPKADTPGCTAQSCSVRDARADFEGLDIAAVGISPDVPKAQKAFDAKYRLGFPLLADPDHAVADAYGVWGEKSLYGRKYMGIIRSSFLIGDDGRILEAWYKVSPKDTVPKALKAAAAG
jgi:peroxiredoxin Q/BCP